MEGHVNRIYGALLGLGAALLAADIAEVEVRQRKIATQRDSALEMGRDLIVAFERSPRQRDVVVIVGVTIVGGDSLTDQFDGGARIAALQRNQPEIVQAVGVARNELEDLAIASFGVSQRPALVARQRRVEQAVNGAVGSGTGTPCGSPLLPVHVVRRVCRRPSEYRPFC